MSMPAPRRGSWLLGLLIAVAVTTPAWLQWTDPRLNLLWEAAKGVDDAKNHMLRLYLLGWLVEHGAWYPRWVPDLFMGYGYPIFNYYAPGFYYLALLLQSVFRFDVWDGYRAAGVVAALVAASGSYALVAGLWARPALGVLAAVTLLYGPYVIQTNLFQRGDIPEALGLALIPWLLLTVWRVWHAATARQTTLWLGAATGIGAAIVLVHNITAVLAAAVAGAWLVYLLCASPSKRGLAAVLLAGGLAAGITAFFWLPAIGERDAVQLELLQEGHLDYRQWLLDPAGNTPKQQSPENRQTRAGLIDLHLFYPHQHQFITTLKPSLAQASLASLAAIVLAGWGARAAWHVARRRAACRGHDIGAIVPLLAVALACWLLTFSFAAPVWAVVPGLAVLQHPGRLLGPAGVCLAIAGAGAVAAPMAWLERWAGRHGHVAGVALAATVTVLVLANGAGGREVPLADDPRAVIGGAIDGRTVLIEEGDRFGSTGTTSGGEFTPRDVQLAVYTAGQRRGRPVFERLYPEADWLGGQLYPLEGDLRLLGWRGRPLQLSVRVANDSGRTGRLGIRQFRFPGWHAWVDGQSVPVEQAPYIVEQQASLGFIAVAIPPGEHTVSLAFGPTPLRLTGMGLTALSLTGGAAALAGMLWRTRLAAPPLLAAGWLIVAGTVGYATWRGVRPLLPAAAAPTVEAAQIDGGVWRAPNLDRSGSGLLVNVAEAARTGQARIDSPSGPSIGPDRFVDVRQLTVTDVDRDRGAAGTSRRQFLYMHPPGSVAVDVLLPTGRQTWFQAALALDPRMWQEAAGDGVQFQVAVQRLGQGGQVEAETVALDRVINPRAGDEHKRWVPVEADLSRWAGSAVRLTLRTGPRGDLTYDWAGWGNPVVAVREFARVRPAIG